MLPAPENQGERQPQPELGWQTEDSGQKVVGEDMVLLEYEVSELAENTGMWRGVERSNRQSIHPCYVSLSLLGKRLGEHLTQCSCLHFIVRKCKAAKKVTNQ